MIGPLSHALGRARSPASLCSLQFGRVITRAVAYRQRLTVIGLSVGCRRSSLAADGHVELAEIGICHAPVRVVAQQILRAQFLGYLFKRLVQINFSIGVVIL